LSHDDRRPFRSFAAIIDRQSPQMRDSIFTLASPVTMAVRRFVSDAHAPSLFVTYSSPSAQCCREAAYFHALEGPMFSGLRSDSMVLSHVWLGHPGGRFQSDGGLRQLHGDGLRQQQCARCAAKQSQASFTLPCRKARDTVALPRLLQGRV